MKNNCIFELSDLTEALFEKAWYLERMRSSGLGGPGHILMVTEDHEEYLLGIEGYDECCPEKTVPLLAKYDQLDRKEGRRRYRVEDNGWTYCTDYATDVLIRDDLYDKMNQVYKEAEHKDLRYSDCYRLLLAVLNSKHNMPRKVYRKTQENLDWDEQEREKRERELARIRLEESDLDWKSLHLNNILSNSIMGCYAFIFKRQEDGSITGYKWTIVFQPKEEAHGGIGTPVVIEAYNLFFNEYRNVAGVLGYTEPGYSDYRQCYEKSTIHDGVHSYGRFVRSYKMLASAKEAVLHRNEWTGWGNVTKNNIIRPSFDERSVAAMERDYEEKTRKEFVVDKDITFGELRCYLSLLDRLSICIKETGNYENFICLRDVPESYDRYYVHGIGMIDSEFYKIGKVEFAASGEMRDLVFLKCIEVMISDEPKSVAIKKEEVGITGE